MDFAQFEMGSFPIVYMKIHSEHFNEANFENYKSSLIHLLLRAKSEKQKMILLLDLFNSDQSTFQMENIMKQAAFYKSIMAHTLLYVQHVYILSNRTDLHVFIKIFKTFAKSVVPYKVVKSIEKIEQNIYKKYHETVDLSRFASASALSLQSSYVFQNKNTYEIEESNENIDININTMEYNDSDEEQEPQSPSS